MMRRWFSIIALLAFSFSTIQQFQVVSAAAETSDNGSPTRTPVLIELFTSEGCSDCPPADALLEKLDRSQPVRSAELIVLSEHVDYWDNIGWKDPYSSHAFSVRQADYARRFRLDAPYTPQMVVDGSMQFVGSDERRATQVTENAAKVEKIRVALSSIRLEGGTTLAVHVETGPLTSPASSHSANVLLALADESDQSNVRRGENAGRTLNHVSVVRNLTRVGTIDDGGTFSKDVTVSTGNAHRRNLRVIAIVQESGVGRVSGLGSARLSN
jgi:hypothetical protein